MRIVLMGPPACGKGTQATRLAQTYGVPALRMGEMLRAERASGSDMGAKIGAIIAAGQLVPDEWTLDLMEPHIKASENGFVLDGFPRRIRQARMLFDLLDGLGGVLDAAFLIEATFDEVSRRASRRREEAISRGEEGRPDDHPKTLHHRYKVFESQTSPLKEFYTKSNTLIRIDGSRSVVATTDAMIAAIGTGA